MSTTILAFAKFGSKEFMEDLINNGTIFLNTVNKFKQFEDDFRGDKNEGVSDLIQSDFTNLELRLPESLGGGVLTLNKSTGLVGQIYINDINYTNSNIYSLYMIYPDEKFKVDNRVFQFGEYVVLIHNPHEFLNRIEDTLDKMNLKYECGVVEYIDKNTFQGHMSIFNKFSSYAYQNEFRFHVRNKEDNPLILKLGSLKDIAKLLPAEYLKYMEIKNLQN